MLSLGYDAGLVSPYAMKEELADLGMRIQAREIDECLEMYALQREASV